MTIRRLQLPGFDPLVFLRKMDARERSLSLLRSGRWTVMAWNPRRTCTGMTVRSVQRAVQKGLKRQRNPAGLPFVGGAIGWIGYDAAARLRGVRSRHPRRSGVPDCCVHIYDHALLWDGERLLAVGGSAWQAAVVAIHARPMPQQMPENISWAPGITRALYRHAFGRVMHAIHEGTVYQLNLTDTLVAHSHQSPRLLAASLLALHDPQAGSYIEHTHSAVISCSPEMFLSIEDGIVRTEPIKGTRPRGVTPDADRRAREALLHDPKEAAELSMIVDLLRNDIAAVCTPGTVRVTEHRALRSTPAVWHTVSTVEGALRRDVTPFAAFLSMLPGGSVTGCPKSSALLTIDRVERRRRGLYCGTSFMLSQCGRLQSSILIRTVVRDGGTLSLGLGGGIVWGTTWQREYAEMQQKARHIVDMPVRQVFIDGEAYQGPSLIALDPACTESTGVFETMRAERGRIFWLRAHLARLRRSAALMHLPVPESTSLTRMLRVALEKAAISRARCKLVWDGQRTIIEVAPLILDPSEQEGIRAITVPCIRAEPVAKALPYHREWQALEHAWQRGAHEALLLLPTGQITEGARSSLVWVKDGVLCTARRGVLPGITRGVVLRLARQLGIGVRLCAPPSLTELLHADEIIVTRATAGILPVLSVNQSRIGRGTVGPITRRLQRALEARHTPTG